MCNECEKPSAIDRRGFMTLAAAVAGGGVMSAGTASADDCLPFLADAQAALTPDQAIQKLMDGNARFTSGESLNCDLLGEMQATAAAQFPFACVLACIDSRSGPELVFDQQIGDIFVARVAGNVPTTEVLGSFEYATKVAGAKAIIVLGHNHCGAIKGAVDRADVGNNLTALLDEIEPALVATPLIGERSSKNHAFVEAAAEQNVHLAVEAFTTKSTVIKELVDTGSVKVIGALYDIETGMVHFLT